MNSAMTVSTTSWCLDSMASVTSEPLELPVEDSESENGKAGLLLEHPRVICVVREFGQVRGLRARV